MPRKNLLVLLGIPANICLALAMEFFWPAGDPRWFIFPAGWVVLAITLYAREIFARARSLIGWILGLLPSVDPEKENPTPEEAASDQKNLCLQLLAELDEYYNKPPGVPTTFRENKRADGLIDQLIEYGLLEESFRSMGLLKWRAITIKLAAYLEKNTLEETRAYSKRLHAREAVSTLPRSPGDSPG